MKMGRKLSGPKNRNGSQSSRSRRKPLMGQTLLCNPAPRRTARLITGCPKKFILLHTTIQEVPQRAGSGRIMVSIAVSPEWFSILRGSSICVPGYGVGTVLDVCPGCSGKPWIDVFIPTADYVSWSKNVTVYFLPPAPAGFSGDLP